MFSDKAHRRRIGLPFYRRCAQLDLNCATVDAYDTVHLRIRNDVRPEDCLCPMISIRM